MKNYPLSVQIWIVFALITLSVSILLSFILPATLRDFFTKEIYATISSAQDLVFNQFDSDIYRNFLGTEFFGEKDKTLENIRTVRHIIIYDDNSVAISYPISTDFLKQVKEEFLAQEDISKEYSGNLEGEKIFYIITKAKTLNQNAFLVSYMSDSYREDLVQALFKKLITVTTLVSLFSWIPALLLSQYLSKPLVDFEKKVGELVTRQWEEPIYINRKDEIGKLGESIEELRCELIRQDEAEQSFLQNISHELKTPVMVIRSFVQAMGDGIYPRGTLEASVEVIDEEAIILEKRINNLLYLTKLDFMSNHKMNKRDFYLDDLVDNVIDRISWSRTDIKWDINLDEMYIKGDPEQWRVVLENLFDNQLRYAKSIIKVSLTRKMDKDILHIWNDGDPIEEELLDNIFGKFSKGARGEIGLGLSIVNRILDMHESKITALNEEDGVSFYIEI